MSIVYFALVDNKGTILALLRTINIHLVNFCEELFYIGHNLVITGYMHILIIC